MRWLRELNALPLKKTQASEENLFSYGVCFSNAFLYALFVLSNVLIRFLHLLFSVR